ncbi:MAG TPA: DUF1761 domain-containing protein [Gemmatimonadaceae bacterium]|jgi:hypothetical protein|nr:DUF1761 domain-containing protein [Gemmatimonadaceae bacterium]
MPHVNYLAVLVAAIVVFVLGWLWYSPFLFLKPWMRARGLDPDAAMAGAKMPAGKLIAELLRCIVLAFVIAHFIRLLGVSNWFIAAHFALLLWIGFPVVLLVGSILWENLPVKVAAINAGDWLVKLLAITIILSVWH